MTISCLAVDDEPLALDVIETFVQKISWLTLVGRCGTSMEALQILRSREIDLLFLDIQLPDLTGFELLRTLSKPPMVVFTTAYAHFAAESYTLDAVDYLVKPFTFERFVRAAQKAAEERTDRHVHNGSSQFFIHTDQGDVCIDVHDILYIKGLNEYAIIKTGLREFVVRESLRDIEERIAHYGYLRVHKSWIVSIKSIAVIDRTFLRVGDAVIPIGRTYHERVRQVVEERRLG
jgi:DNA-binding LytR/AlgR family response regulator